MGNETPTLAETLDGTQQQIVLRQAPGPLAAPRLQHVIPVTAELSGASAIHEERNAGEGDVFPDPHGLHQLGERFVLSLGPLLASERVVRRLEPTQALERRAIGPEPVCDVAPRVVPVLRDELVQGLVLVALPARRVHARVQRVPPELLHLRGAALACYVKMCDFEPIVAVVLVAQKFIFWEIFHSVYILFHEVDGANNRRLVFIFPHSLHFHLSGVEPGNQGL